MSDLHLNLNLLAQAIVGGIVLWGFKTLQTTLREIRDHLRQLNGRVGKLEQRLEDHTGLDDERHEANTNRLDRNQDSIQGLRDQLSTFIGRLLRREE